MSNETSLNSSLSRSSCWSASTKSKVLMIMDRCFRKWFSFFESRFANLKLNDPVEEMIGLKGTFGLWVLGSPYALAGCEPAGRQY